MRDHIRREGTQEISAAWFVIPMSIAAAVLIAISAEAELAGAELASPIQQVELPIDGVMPAPAAPALPEPDPQADPQPEIIATF